MPRKYNTRSVALADTDHEEGENPWIVQESKATSLKKRCASLEKRIEELEKKLEKVEQYIAKQWW